MSKAKGNKIGALALACIACCVLLPLRLTFAQSAAASIKIDAGRVEGRISPLLYGQFMEFMYEGVKGGVHAELLRDRSFETAPNAIGLPRYWERYPDDRNDDYALAFLWDGTAAYPPKRNVKVEMKETESPEHALRVDAGNGVIPRHGFYQPRVPVRSGVEYRGYFWLKAEKFEGGLTVALESDSAPGEVYAEAKVGGIVVGDWRRYEFTLKPTKADPLARFALLFDGRGRVWVDQISLMPGDAAPGGVRRDVFEKIKALKPAFMRWPGGNVAQDYRWMWGVGPREERVTWTNLSWKNELEPGDFGTDEYIQFARAAGAEPTITVNIEGRGATVEEAAAWVEYCNGAATTKYGAMRAANGHPEPYNVKYWEVGNEIWGAWVRGHSDADTYARNYNRYHKAMRAVDPSIQFIAVGDNDMNWNRTVLKTAGANIDYLAIHHYYGRGEAAGDPLNLMARPLFFERFYAQVEQLRRELVPRKSIKLAINEWGLDLPVERQYSMESALYGARLMNVFERSNDVVGMSAVSDLVNGWPGGIIQANRHGVFVSPVYLVNQLYSESLGAERLSAEVSGPTFDSSKEGRGVPYLDAVVSRSADGKRIFIKAVNTDVARPLAVAISVQGAGVAPQGKVATVAGSSPAAWNDFSTPEAVSIKRSQVSAGRAFTVELPKNSVSVITLTATP